MTDGTTTCPSEEEVWEAEEERRIRRAERIRAAARYVVLLLAATLLLCAVLWFGVRKMGAGRYDAWQSVAESVRRRGG